MTGIEYAGFWIRFLSYLIDGVILFIIGILLSVAIGGVEATLLQFAVGAVYTIGFWTAEGATPGKMIVGLRIVTVDGEYIDFGRSILRYIGYFLSGITLGVGFLIIAFNRQKRGLHDYVAGTIVVKTR